LTGLNRKTAVSSPMPLITARLWLCFVPASLRMCSISCLSGSGMQINISANC
jgi:hypothetical protein